jgi:hypothetical protein
MNRVTLPAFILLASLSAAQPDLGHGWRAESGDWTWTRAPDLMLLQRAPAGVVRAANDSFPPERNIWRCVVEPAFGATSAGFTFAAAADLSRGITVELGGSEVGGFALKTARGETLWEDRWAPWQAYDAYVLEGILEEGRVRAQMLKADRKTLLSQSPWVDLPPDALARTGCVVLHTSDSRARFWTVEASDEPLSPITDDAPNKRRLAQGPEGDWNVRGPGNWMWTDATRQRMRQYANVERAWAVDCAISGCDRIWRSAVRVFAPAGGAGIIVKSDEQAETGFIIWLGGTYGAGCLMVYRLSSQALWASAQDKWHYDEDLVLQAETKGAQLRARLLAADGKTVIAESPWIEMTPDEAQREGCLAFHTWKGNAEFWSFTGP